MGIAMLAVLGLGMLLFHWLGDSAGEYAMMALWALLILVPVALLGARRRWFDSRKKP